MDPDSSEIRDKVGENRRQHYDYPYGDTRGYILVVRSPCLLCLCTVPNMSRRSCLSVNTLSPVCHGAPFSAQSHLCHDVSIFTSSLRYSIIPNRQSQLYVTTTPDLAPLNHDVCLNTRFVVVRCYCTVISSF